MSDDTTPPDDHGPDPSPDDTNPSKTNDGSEPSPDEATPSKIDDGSGPSPDDTTPSKTNDGSEPSPDEATPSKTDDGSATDDNSSETPASPTPDASMAGSLGTRATRAGVVSLGSYFGAQLLRLAGNLILTRLLFEEAFGLMALVGVFLQGLHLFSDMGIGPNLIQSKRGEEPEFQDTAWTLQVGRGSLLWLLAAIGAAPIAVIYEAPALALLLPVTGITAFFAGFTSTNVFTLNRRLSMKQLAVVELLSQLAALVVMTVWAWFDRSVWALVAGAVAMSFTNMVLSHALLPGRRNRLRFDRPSARELFRFGRWIFLSTALSFLAAQSDRMIFGKLITLKVLGVYNIAMMAAMMPTAALSRLANTVIFPVLSRLFERGEDVDKAFRDVRKPLLMLGGYLIAGVIAGAPVIINLMYDERFVEAGWMLRILSIGGWFGFLEYSIMSGLLAAGRTGWIASGAAARLVAVGVFIPTGYMLGGFPMALVGYACSDVVRLIVSVIAARKLGIRSWWLDFWTTGVVALSAVVGDLTSRWVGTWVSPGFGGEFVQAIFVFLSVTAVWLPFSLPYLLQLLANRRAKQAAVG